MPPINLKSRKLYAAHHLSVGRTDGMGVDIHLSRFFWRNITCFFFFQMRSAIRWKDFLVPKSKKIELYRRYLPCFFRFGKEKAVFVSFLSCFGVVWSIGHDFWSQKSNFLVNFQLWKSINDL